MKTQCAIQKTSSEITESRHSVMIYTGDTFSTLYRSEEFHRKSRDGGMVEVVM